MFVVKLYVLSMQRRSKSPQSCHCCSQIHDELLFEVATDQLRRGAALIRECMEGAMSQLVAQPRVPMPVEMAVGRSWGQLEPYRL